MHRQMADMMKKMGKGGMLKQAMASMMGKGGTPNDMANLDPATLQAMAKSMPGSLPPGMGGMGGGMGLPSGLSGMMKKK
jgi:signal recognition particle subunit SRP54